MKKAHEDKLSKVGQDYEIEKTSLLVEARDKQDQLLAKTKKDLKASQDKAKAEQRNLLDQVKNEVQRKLAEYDWETSKSEA